MIKQLRKACNLTQEELARESGISVSTIQWIEKEGITGLTEYNTGVSLSRSLGVSLDVLFLLSPKMKPATK